MAKITLPGLVDVHTHLRVPGGEHKEDFDTGTAAALAGGITTVLAMPNTSPPLSTPKALETACETAVDTARCQVGVFAGASPADLDQLEDCAPYAVALKIYLNDTYGPLRVEELPDIQRCFSTWPRHKIIAMHAEGQSVAVGIAMSAIYKRPVHFCHISRRDEIQLIATAKASGLRVTCEVTPHHLFLTKADVDRLGPLGDMRPRLAEQEDVEALWAHINTTIDCIATDHAPHTLEEKAADSPPPGVPGLETSLPLMLTAVHNGRLSLERLTELMAVNPRQIFGLPTNPHTWVEIDTDAEYTIENENLYTKCGWSPFAGTKVRGKVMKVIIKERTVFEDGRVTAEPGSGSIIIG
ncbi:MAG: amidohydrolase family protein [Candidatus Promineifilaceae bacterium]